MAHGRIKNAPEYLELAHAQLRRLPLEWREHAAAVVAALQLSREDRERLGAYFTPPSLVFQVLTRLQNYGYQPSKHRVIDPAAGGAAFLAPLHGLVTSTTKQGDLRVALRLLTGIEINPRLARATKNLLAWRSAAARGANEPYKRDFDAADRCITVADTLSFEPKPEFDVVVGNPPYVRIGRGDFQDFVERFPSLTDKGGYLNLSMAFLTHSLSFLKPGGLLSFVMPAGIIGGPSFAAFRRSIAAEILCIDRVERRDGIFLDVQQDCVVLTLRHQNLRRHLVQVRSISATGVNVALGKLRLPLDGSPWELPCPNWIRTGRSLSELGWYGKVGPVVPHRWTDRITNRVGKRSLPLVWAAAIRPKGKVDYTHMRQCVAGARVVVNPELPYVIRRPCILIQRTANSKQTRRINAAVVDRRSLSKIGPFLAENHVIALFPPAGLSNDKNLRQMAKTLNSEECTRLYNRVSGSTSISLKILMSMRLPVVKIPTR